jgi:hypothetical protein
MTTLATVRKHPVIALRPLFRAAAVLGTLGLAAYAGLLV